MIFYFEKKIKIFIEFSSLEKSGKIWRETYEELINASRNIK
jgi:hypothetical protein